MSCKHSVNILFLGLAGQALHIYVGHKHPCYMLLRMWKCAVMPYIILCGAALLRYHGISCCEETLVESLMNFYKLCCNYSMAPVVLCKVRLSSLWN